MTLLSDALTIWRWGRQTVLKPGKALGSFEVWARWCRDPLLALDARDPVDRITEIKAADPQRRAAVELFEVWWTNHKDAVVTAAELAPEVIEIIDIKARHGAEGGLQYSRQRVARVVAGFAGTRIGGYVFDQIKDVSRSRPVAQYKLQLEKGVALVA